MFFLSLLNWVCLALPLECWLRRLLLPYLGGAAFGSKSTPVEEGELWGGSSLIFPIPSSTSLEVSGLPNPVIVHNIMLHRKATINKWVINLPNSKNRVGYLADWMEIIYSYCRTWVLLNMDYYFCKLERRRYFFLKKKTTCDFIRLGCTSFSLTTFFTSNFSLSAIYFPIIDFNFPCFLIPILNF